MYVNPGHEGIEAAIICEIYVFHHAFKMDNIR